MSFEESLVLNASPTLASIKIANLYSFRFGSWDECCATIHHFNEMMNKKGIYIELLKNSGDFYLIYVYRKTQLERTLCEGTIRDFLAGYDYPEDSSLQACLAVLKSRLEKEKDFPHEIGVFLGYPLEDVKAFIYTKGDRCVLCGDWKVYHDEETARCLFCKYKRCKEIYVKVYKAGRRFSDMLVTA